MNKQEYSKYLKSPEWQALRARTKKKNHCVGCLRKKPLQLHHMVYRNNLAKTTKKDLIWLCGDCHKLFHQMHGLLAPKELLDGPHPLLRAYTKRVLQAAVFKAGYLPHKNPPNLEDSKSGILASEKVFGRN